MVQGPKHKISAEKAKEESLKVRERENLIIYIRGELSRFGHKTVSLVLSDYLRWGGLNHTMQLLNLPPKKEIKDQLEVLVDFMTRNGSQFLIKRLMQQRHSNLTPEGESIEEILNRILDDTESVALKKLKQKQEQKEEDNLENRKTKTLEKISDSLHPEPTDAPRHSDANTPWNGVERRSGKDRRSGEERRRVNRRQNVETIFKNQRFGKDRRSGEDRRSGKERRKNWPPKS